MSRPVWTARTYEMVADALRSEYVSAVTPDARIAIMNVAVEGA